MADCVFDIETAHLLDTEIPPSLVQRLQDSEDAEDPEAWREKLGLYALSASVVTIAMLNPESGRGEILYDARHGELAEIELPEGIEATLSGGDESEILERFWAAVRKFRRVITYNGRGFDVPFLMQRSLIRSVPISRNLMPPRFNLSASHLDLAEVLSQFRATRPYGLAPWTEAIGERSPKEGEVAGKDVGQAFHEGKTAAIAEYCMRDVVATTKLAQRIFEQWGPML
ncbi:MAG TPA: ribonuclease H-like domain-containing protein [Candidatus Krumholzibacteria bacterium]|jgi:DNA polymerase elongation subunit (family B)